MTTCCGKAITPYDKNYGDTVWYREDGTQMIMRNWETGFRCKKCGRIRIPDGRKLDSSYMDSLEAIRLEGIQFDATFDNVKSPANIRL